MLFLSFLFFFFKYIKSISICSCLNCLWRFEMRGLLVNNEDLLRTNTQLNNELKRLREQMIEMERENQSVGERFREMEVWLFFFFLKIKGCIEVICSSINVWMGDTCVVLRRLRWSKPERWWWRPTLRSMPSTSLSSRSKIGSRMLRYAKLDGSS